MYIVIELQGDGEGHVANIVTAYETLAEAQSKYFTILASAAVSSVPVHSATILNETGMSLANQSFGHAIASK